MVMSADAPGFVDSMRIPARRGERDKMRSMRMWRQSTSLIDSRSAAISASWFGPLERMTIGANGAPDTPVKTAG